MLILLHFRGTLHKDKEGGTMKKKFKIPDSLKFFVSCYTFFQPRKYKVGVLALFVLLCILGGACVEKSQSVAGPVREDNISEALKGTLCNNVSSPDYSMSHPLVCIKNGDYPDGSEMVLIVSSSPRQLVHVVFPQKTTVPDDLKRLTVLHGHFQNIKNKWLYKIKRPEDNYRYFVVQSWEYQKN